MSTLLSPPNEAGLKCPSVCLFDFNEIWHVGRGRWLMHDGMQYDPIQSQGHEPFRVGNPTIFKSYLLRHLQWELATDHGFLNYGTIIYTWSGRIFMATEGKAIRFYLCNLFIFSLFCQLRRKTSHGIQPNLTSRLEVVLIYKCLTNSLGPLTQNLGHKKHLILDHFFHNLCTRHHISLEQNVSWTNKNANVNLQCVPATWLTYRDLWPRNGWHPFAYCDATFGGHYVAAIKVVTSLVDICPGFCELGRNISCEESAISPVLGSFILSCKPIYAYRAPFACLEKMGDTGLHAKPMLV